MADLDLPNDITKIVRSNLPVKSLLRFKCVSKPWNSWISSRRRKGAIARISNWNSTLSFRFINQQLTSEKTNDIKLLSCSFMGSCDGLILICRDEHIYLWNPATQFCAKVLELDLLNDDDYYIRAGLCFDSSKNVYKAVLIMHKDYGGEFVIVASFKDKRWRIVKFPYDIRSLRDRITVHGRLHYRLRVKKKEESNCDPLGHCNEIIYFDPISEKFHMLPVPEPNTNLGENAIVGLGVLNECLCMTCLDDYKGGVEILIMKEYGVRESWTSLYFIRRTSFEDI